MATMKLETSQLPDVTDFEYKECVIAGEDCIWFYPHMEGVKWTTKNLMFRSSIWRKSDYTLVSAGFKKFFNWTQEPDIYPAPSSNDKINCVEKIDGSCLLVTKYKGQLITRTRRAFSHIMLNGDEIDLLQRKYPKAFNNDILDHENCTFIYEWTTPSNIIVVQHAEPDIRLIGCVDHSDYSLVSQDVLDVMSDMIRVKRPKRVQFASIDEMIKNVAELKGEEGICVYYGKDQHIRKIKSDWYLSVHNFRNKMNLKNLVELYFVMGMPSYQDFCGGVLNQFQYEGLMMSQSFISQICDGMKVVKRVIQGMENFVSEMKKDSKRFPDRKAQAAHVFSSYGKTNRADIVFIILDGKSLDAAHYKKLLFQELVDL